jgi:exonuclease SbcC
LTPQVAALREEHQRVLEESEKAKTAVRSFEALKAAENELVKLESQGSEISALRVTLASHERANQVRPYQEESARIEREISAIHEHLPGIESACASSSGKLTEAKAHLSELEKTDEQQKPARLSRLQEIESLKKSLEAISSRQKEIAQLELRIAGNEKQRVHQSAQLTDREGRIQALSARLQGLKAVAATQLPRTESVRSLERIQKLSADAKNLQSRVTNQEKELAQYQNQLVHAQGLEQQALDAEILAEKEWIAGQAAHLASLIKPGDSCPVCGSREHPSLAQPATSNEPAGGTPRQRLVRAKENHKETLNSLQTARTQHELASQRLATERAHLEKLLGENPSLLEDRNWVLELRQAQASLAESVAATQEIEQADIQLAQLQRSRTEIDEALARSRESIAIDQGKLGTLQAALEELEGRFAQAQGVPLDVQGLESERLALSSWIEKQERDLAKARAELPSLIAAVAAFAEKKEAATTRLILLKGNLQNSNRSLEASLAEQGFANHDEFLKALATDTELKVKRDRISTYEVSAARMNELKRAYQKAISESGFTEAPDLAESENRKNESQERLDQMSTAIVGARTTRDSIQRALDSSAQSLARSAEVEEIYRRMGHIASIAEGGKDNALKLSFHRYVLAVFFDEIIESANLRLRLLSDGRYGLRRPVLPGSRVGARGLDLVVEDAMTGKERPTGSLSGGEGFLASLSLALGLSDVVQSDRSGIPMEAVFIDEGFGNLDEGAVENVVLRALKDLRQSGRMVGIISHIPHLRNLIPVQLQVTKSEKGSRVTVLGT